MRGSNSEMFVNMTKKMRQQVLSRIFAPIHGQLVVYNVKMLFNVFLLYHRDDSVIQAFCNVFTKRTIYNAQQLRREIINKNTKDIERKKTRNKLCRQVMEDNPRILRTFDLRTLNYIRDMLLDSTEAIHNISNCLPVILCLNERDVDTMFDRCRMAHSRRYDFPIDLLPRRIRAPIVRLLDMVSVPDLR